MKGSDLTLETLDELERLEREATPGPFNFSNFPILPELGSPEYASKDHRYIVRLLNLAPALIAAARKWLEWEKYHADNDSVPAHLTIAALESENRALVELVREVLPHVNDWDHPIGWADRARRLVEGE